MDFPARSLPRLAYSFPSGTCDLSDYGPGCCVFGDDDSTSAVMLESDWHHLLPRLQDLGALLASAMSGPLSLAQMWVAPSFAPVPGTHQMLDLTGGAELELRPLRRIMAVVEQGHSRQEIISLQLFDDRSQGVLKLLLTNLSDRTAFAELVREFASPFPVHLHPHPASPLPMPALRPPPVEMVRGLWHGLARTQPDSAFPGLPDCSRLTALEAAGPDLAWPVSEAALRRALNVAVESGLTLQACVRNRGLFAPGSLTPLSASGCTCGTTWFSAQSQLTLRRTSGRLMVTRHMAEHRATGGSLDVECFLEDGAFAGRIALDPATSEAGRTAWAAALTPAGRSAD